MKYHDRDEIFGYDIPLSFFFFLPFFHSYALDVGWYYLLMMTK